MLKGFKDFLLRGNVVDLAVAVIIGAAFGGVVAAFSNDFIGAIGGSPDFGDAGFTVNDSKIVYGSTLTAAINFVIVAAVVYFVVIVPLKTMMERGKTPEESPAPTDEAVILAEIRDELRAGRR